MARSTYIYIVEDMEGKHVAAFTVKHECISWIIYNQMDVLYEDGFVSTYGDGTGRHKSTVPIKDFISLDLKQKRSFVDGSDAGGERE